MNDESDPSIYAELRRRGHYENPQDAVGAAAGERAIERLRRASAGEMAAFWAEAAADVVPSHVVLEWVEECVAPSLDAAPVYVTLADHAPPDGDFYFLYNLARDLRLNCRDPERAIPLLERALAVVPTDGDSWLELGNARRDAGQDGPALDAWRQGVEVAPEQLALRRNQGMHHKQHGRWREAAAAMEACCARSERPEDWHVYGHCLQEAGERDAAAVALRRAVELYAARDEKPATQYWQAAALARLGEAAAALALLAAAVRRAPQLADDAAVEEDFSGLRGTDAWRAAVAPPRT